MQKFFLLFVALLSITLCLKAQVSESLGNAEVIQLATAGVDDHTIINKIKSSGSLRKFDVTTSGIIELKQGGVSEGVINFLINYTKAVEKNEKASWGNLNESLANIFETGIYLQAENSDYFRKLDASVITGGRVRNGIFTVNEFSTLAGGTSSFLIDDPKPSFYFYFDSASLSLNRNAGFSRWEDMATNPNDFKLVKLVRKRGTRGFQTQRGSETGIHGKSIIPFTYARLSATQFRIDLYAPLEEGEYCFYYSNNSLLYNRTNFSKNSNQKDVKVYDFTVSKPENQVDARPSQETTQQKLEDVIQLPIDVSDVIELRVTTNYGTIFKVYYLKDGVKQTVSQLPNRRKWSHTYRASKKNEEVYLEALPGLKDKVRCRIFINKVLVYDSKDSSHPRVSVNKK